MFLAEDASLEIGGICNGGWVTGKWRPAMMELFVVNSNKIKYSTHMHYKAFILHLIHRLYCLQYILFTLL